MGVFTLGPLIAGAGEANTTPSRVATPKVAIKPIPDMTLNGMPRNTSAAMPPVTKSGTIRHDNPVLTGKNTTG